MAIKKKISPKVKSVKKEKIIDVDPSEVIEENKLLENPLLQSQVIEPQTELETKIALVNEIESIATLNKQQLMIKRQQVELEVDNKKLDVAKKTISNVEKIMEAVSNTDVIERVTENINTAQDLKYMAEAAEKFSNTLKNLLNPSVADEFGGRKRTKIFASFQTSNGDTASIGVSVDDN